MERGIKKGVLLFIFIIFLSNFVYAADVAYILNTPRNANAQVMSVFSEIGLNVTLVKDTNILRTDLTKYRLIFVGDERLRKTKTLPIYNYPSVIMNKYYGKEWGVTDADGISQLASTAPLSVRLIDNGLIQVYTQAKVGTVNIPYYYLADGNKANFTSIARTYVGGANGLNDIGDVISTAKAGTHLINGKTSGGNICYYGIAKTKYWTNEARKLFKECVESVLIQCYQDSDCDDGDAHTQDICVNNGTINSNCVHEPIICLNDNECGIDEFVNGLFCDGISGNDIYRYFNNYTCLNSGTVQSSCDLETLSLFNSTCSFGCFNGTCLPGIHDVAISLIFADSINGIRITNSTDNPLLDPIPNLIRHQKYNILFNVTNKGNFIENLTFSGVSGCSGISFSSYTNNLEPGKSVKKEYTNKNATCAPGFYNLNVTANLITGIDENLSDNVRTRTIRIVECEVNTNCGDKSSYLSCSGNSVINTTITPTCTSGSCGNVTTNNTIETCSGGGFINNYCFNSTAVYSNYSIPICSSGACGFNYAQFFNITCDFGCSGGVCNPENIPPQIKLISPANNSNSINPNVNFVYNVTDNSTISNCSLIIDGNIVVIDNTIFDVTNSFSYTLAIGSHFWSVRCSDEFGNTGNSETRTVNIITCFNNSNCNDGNIRTEDICVNPGAINSFCSHNNITCFNNLECGTNFLSGNLCSGNNVIRNFLNFTCNNAGTASSFCTNQSGNYLLETCSQRCIAGSCVVINCTQDSDCIDANDRTIDQCINPNTTASFCRHTEVNCLNNNDCGFTGFLGDNFCSNNDVFKYYQNSTCISPGTLESSCSILIFPKLIDECDDSNSRTLDFCVEPAHCENRIVECFNDSECIGGGLVNNFCSGSEVWSNYSSPLCLSPGTVQSACSFSFSQIFNQTCAFGCVNGTCLPGIHDVLLSDFSNSIGKIRLEFQNGSDILENPAELECNQKYIIGITVKNNGSFFENVTFNGDIDGLLFNHNPITNFAPSDSTLKTKTVNFTLAEGFYNISVQAIIGIDINPFNNFASRQIKIECEEDECQIDSDCGDTTLINNYCIGNQVWSNYSIPVCLSGECGVDYLQVLNQTCSFSCANGTCIAPTCPIGSLNPDGNCSTTLYSIKSGYFDVEHDSGTRSYLNYIPFVNDLRKLAFIQGHIEEFNLTGLEGKTIVSAEFTQYCTGKGSNLIYVFKTLKSWNESFSYAVNGGGDRQELNGLYENTQELFTGMKPVLISGIYQINGNVKSAVQNWADTPISNFGFVIREKIEGDSPRNCYQKNAPSGRKPKLEIIYTP